jgi:hypothetical protein
MGLSYGGLARMRLARKALHWRKRAVCSPVVARKRQSVHIVESVLLELIGGKKSGGRTVLSVEGSCEEVVGVRVPGISRCFSSMIMAADWCFSAT